MGHKTSESRTSVRGCPWYEFRSSHSIFPNGLVLEPLGVLGGAARVQMCGNNGSAKHCIAKPASNIDDRNDETSLSENSMEKITDVFSFMHSFPFISFHFISFHSISIHSFTHSCSHSFNHAILSFHFMSIECHFISSPIHYIAIRVHFNFIPTSNLSIHSCINSSIRSFIRSLV